MKNKLWLRNKGFLIIIIISFFLFIFDWISTIILNKDLIPFLEVNPLYRFFGSIIPIFLFNILMFLFFWWAYNRSKSGATMRYWILTLMIITILFRIFAIHNALDWNQKNITADQLEEIKQTYTPEVIGQAQKIYAITAFAPILFCFITFFFWKLDHKIQRKDKEEKT